jgi:glutamine---fructose-6-phosphate transaminase (isomerizing)
MCGIVGYIGEKQCSEILLDGLKKLEYRGYDSAGIAVFNNEKSEIIKAKGKLNELNKILNENTITGTTGIGHTRWATHGKPSNENSHPHKSGKVTVVHNGIIENYMELKESLLSKGREFSSETDTEVFAHLIDENLKNGDSPVEALKNCLEKIRGTWALAILIDGFDYIIAAKNGSPLILGYTDSEGFLASDIPALLPYTKQMIFLEDGDIALLKYNKIEVFDEKLNIIERKTEFINWNMIMAEKGGFKHFMLKEIFEQPRSITDTIRGRINKDKDEIFLENFDFDMKKIKKIIIVACGTSYYAGLTGKFLIESIARIPVEVDLGSEFRYRNPICSDEDLLIAISQSGETADTLAACKEARKKGTPIYAISNVLNSQITRIADSTFYTHAGPEIGVASTKAFTSQLAALYLIAIYLGKLKQTINKDETTELINELTSIPSKINQIISQCSHLNVISRRYSKASDFLYMGRGVNYPIALEGALKMKEISYIHAEGYPAGEMKHGPIALIDENIPVVVIATQGEFYEKIINNLEEVRSREGRVIAIATQGDTKIGNVANDLFLIPEVNYLFQPILTVIPLQLIAYYTADFRGNDVDQPRNLAKSVTVE